MAFEAESTDTMLHDTTKPDSPREVVADNGGPFTLDGTRTFLVGHRRVAVIDPGPALDSHVEAVAAAADGADLVTVLVTHEHGDHDGATAKLAEITGARVLGFSAVADADLADGESVDTDQGELIALSTPGHAERHLVFHWPRNRALFAGDLILGQGDTTWVGEYPGCVADYLASLKRLDELDLEVIHPAHGPDIRDVAEGVERFRRHRLERIDQVREALSRTPRASAVELVDMIYGDTVPPGLKGAARTSVQAILDYLARPS